MKPHLSIVTLGVRDLTRSLAFYRDGLGWLLAAGSSEEIAFFEVGGVLLALYPREALAEDAGLSENGLPDGGFPGFTLAHNVPDKSEVVPTLADAESAGATIIKEAEEVFWGGYSGYFSDPDGYLWEVAWAPPVTLGDQATT